MGGRTLRFIVLVCFLALMGASVGSCIIRTKRGHHHHAVKHRKHHKHKKYKKRKKRGKHRHHH